jgi:hypothetical protein
MRPLKLRKISAIRPHQKEIMERLRISELQEKQRESLILKIMLKLPDSSHSIDDRISYTLKSLQNLEKTSLEHPSKNLFDRFCAFYARQSLIALEAEGWIDNKL